MDSQISPTAQEAMEKLEKIQKGEKPEEVQAQITELENHKFFTNGDLETVETQIAIREKIDELLGGFKILSNDEFKGRLEALHKNLSESIEKKEKTAKPNQPPVVGDAENEDETLTTSEPSTQGEAPEVEPEEEDGGEQAEMPQSQTEGEFEAQEPQTNENEPESESAKERAEREKEETLEKAKQEKEASLEKLKPMEALFKDILKNPEDFNVDSKAIRDPAIRAMVGVLKGNKLWPSEGGFDQAKFDQLSAYLRSSEKIPTASQAKKIAEAKKLGVSNSDELDSKMSVIEEEIDRAEGVVETLNTQVAQQTTTIQAMRGNNAGGDKEAVKMLIKQLETLNGSLTKKKEEIRASKNQLKILKEIQPLIGGKKISPRQLLLKVIQFTNEEEKSLKNLGERADRLIAEQEKGMGSESKWDKVSRFLKPSLKATLREFAKIDQLAGMKPEDLEELVKLRNNADGLTEWVEKLKENAKKVLPALMGYLQMAVVEGKLNESSRGSAMELLNGLRTIRNKILVKTINANPELANAKPQVRRQAYLTEMNQWDERSVQVNREIVNDLVRKNYLKKLSWGVGLGVAGYTVAPLVSLPALSSAISYIGWSALAKLGGVGGYLMGKKLIKEYKPEHETLWKQAGGRTLGFALLGVVGLAAPELISGAKFLFKKRKEIGKGATQTGAAVATTAGVSWAVTKGTGKVLAWPFKKIFGRKSGVSALKKAA